MENKDRIELAIVLMLFFVSGAIIFTPMISAVQPTQQYNKIYLSPFYQASLTQNINYTYAVSVTPPDKISSVKSAIITFDAYINPARTFNVWVDGKQCNNPSYTVSTTYASAGKSTVYFDCSNIINQAGTYNVTLQITGGNIGSTTGWLDLTYMNNPAGTLTLHGTEYQIGDNAKVWIQLLMANQTPISNAICYADIYTPAGTIYVERTLMTNMYHDGIYYYNLVAPSTVGVYPAIALCYYTAGQTNNNATSYVINNGAFGSGTLADTYLLDGNFLRVAENNTGGFNRQIDVAYNFSNGTLCNVSELLMTGISLVTTTRWFAGVSGDDMSMYVYNYTTGGWIALSNKIVSGAGFKDVSNSLQFNNLTKAGLVNGSGTNLRFKFNDTNLTDGSSNNFDVDYLQLTCDQLTTPLAQEVRGSSEMHISDFSYINFTSSINTSQLVSDVWNYNGTVNPNILSQFASSVWNLFNSTYNFINSIATSVWNFPARNLTYTPNQNITTQVINLTTTNVTVVNQTVNVTTQQVNVLNQTVNVTDVNLTVLNQTVEVVNQTVNVTYQTVNVTTDNVTVINQTVNVTTETVNVDENAIANAVWTHTPDRNLTYYETSNVNVTINGSDIASQVWNYNGTINNNLLNQIAKKVQCYVQQLFSKEGEWVIDLSSC